MALTGSGARRMTRNLAFAVASLTLVALAIGWRRAMANTLVRPRAFRTAVGVFLSCMLLYWWNWYDPRLLTVDWQDRRGLPFATTAGIELAEWHQPLKRGSLALVCGPDGPRLLLRRQSFIPRELRAATRGATVSVNNTRRELNIDAGLVDWGIIDTVATAPLSPAQLADLAAWFGNASPRRVWFDFGESGSPLSGVADGGAVRGLARRCAAAG